MAGRLGCHRRPSRSHSPSITPNLYKLGSLQPLSQGLGVTSGCGTRRECLRRARGVRGASGKGVKMENRRGGREGVAGLLLGTLVALSLSLFCVGRSRELSTLCSN